MKQQDKTKQLKSIQQVLSSSKISKAQAKKVLGGGTPWTD